MECPKCGRVVEPGAFICPGCEFILDRLLEKEGDNVIACVARRSRRCSVVVWADCAAHVGPHADGGPAAPVPLEEEE